MTGYPVTKVRSRPPENVLPFERIRTAVNLTEIPASCICTWVPCPKWLLLGNLPGLRRPDIRQPWLTQGWALKFANSSCPAGYKHG